MRISREQMFMEMANTVAKRSTCFRLNVGAIIVADGRVRSIGYNGRPPHEPHCEGLECPGRFICSETIHAEDNALRYLPTFNPPQMQLYTTNSPCEHCSQLILEFNRSEGRGSITGVYFGTPYRIKDPLDMLEDNGIAVFQVMPSGVVKSWTDFR